jgi:hypothetical protein
VTYFDGHQLDVPYVMPAQAGIQSQCLPAWDPNKLDSRFRGNDGKLVVAKYVTVIANGSTKWLRRPWLSIPFPTIGRTHESLPQVYPNPR